MLDIMRKHSNSWLIIFLFGIIVFAFGFYPGASSVGRPSSYAAEVNGQVITYPELQMSYQQQIRLIQTNQPDFSPEGPVQDMLKRSVLEQLINRTLLAEAAEKQDFSVSDRDLADYIRDNLFGGEQKVDRQVYQRAIYSNYRMSENQFESLLRRDLTADTMGALVDGSVYTKDKKALATQKAKFFQNYVAYLRKNADITTN